jgi:hypothetical protein
MADCRLALRYREESNDRQGNGAEAVMLAEKPYPGLYVKRAQFKACAYNLR